MADKVVDTGWVTSEEFPRAHRREVDATVDGNLVGLALEVSTYGGNNPWIGLFWREPGAESASTRVWDMRSQAPDLDGAKDEIESWAEEWVGTTSKALTLLAMSVKAKENPKP